MFEAFLDANAEARTEEDFTSKRLRAEAWAEAVSLLYCCLVEIFAVDLLLMTGVIVRVAAEDVGDY